MGEGSLWLQLVRFYVCVLYFISFAKNWEQKKKEKAEWYYKYGRPEGGWILCKFWVGVCHWDSEVLTLYQTRKESFHNPHWFHSNATKTYTGNFLIRSVLKSNDQPGTFKGARKRCNTCPFIPNADKITGPKQSIKITDRFTCTSANVIYCITCTLCKKIYIVKQGGD